MDTCGSEKNDNRLGPKSDPDGISWSSLDGCTLFLMHLLPVKCLRAWAPFLTGFIMDCLWPLVTTHKKAKPLSQSIASSYLIYVSTGSLTKLSTLSCINVYPVCMKQLWVLKNVSLSLLCAFFSLLLFSAPPPIASLSYFGCVDSLSDHHTISFCASTSCSCI